MNTATARWVALRSRGASSALITADRTTMAVVISPLGCDRRVDSKAKARVDSRAREQLGVKYESKNAKSKLAHFVMKVSYSTN